MKKWQQLGSAALGIVIVVGGVTTAVLVSNPDTNAQVAQLVELDTNGTSVNACNNPVVDRDLTGWGRVSGGGAPTRIPVTEHVVADEAIWLNNNATNARFYMPNKDVTAGEQWTFGVDNWLDNAPNAQIRMRVDWYSATSAYLGNAVGPLIPVETSATESWTRVEADFTVPVNATRANPLVELQGPVGSSWVATACDLRITPETTPPTTTTEPVPTTDPTTTPPTTDPTTTLPPTTTVPPPLGDTAQVTQNWGAPEWSYEFDTIAGWNLYDDPTSQHGVRKPENCVVVDGILEVRSEPNRDTCGMSDANNDHVTEYGRWETRVRSVSSAPAGQGWMSLNIEWPESEVWPRDGERDWREHRAGAACYSGFIHYPGHTPQTQYQLPANCPVGGTSAWHNVAFEVTPTHLRGWVDGVLWYEKLCDADLCQMPGGGHSTIQNDDQGSAAGHSATTYIDYLRYWPLS